jgi:GNAT superfamily N-acetyltransferase
VHQLALRAATEGDLERLVIIHTGAFPDARGAAARRRNFEHNALGTLSDLQVVTRGDAIVGHAFLFSLGVFFGGRRVPVGGIASVGVAPEARGRGVGSWLIDKLHELSHDRGDALTMLYAFRYAFYERFGYARVGTSKRLSFAPESVPRALRQLARSAEIRAPQAGDLAAMRQLYEVEAASTTGALDRPTALWERLALADRTHTILLEQGGVATGYVAFEHVQIEPHAATKLVVRELCAPTALARRTLLGVLGSQADQCAEIEIEVASDDPIDLALGDVDAARHGRADVEHAFGTLVGGPMIRTGDLDRALLARGWPRDGRATLRSGGLARELVVTSGQLQIGPAQGDGVSLAGGALSAIAFGSLAVADARDLGMATGDDEAIAAAGALLAQRHYFSRDPF